MIDENTMYEVEWADNWSRKENIVDADTFLDAAKAAEVDSKPRKVREPMSDTERAARDAFVAFLKATNIHTLADVLNAIETHYQTEKKRLFGE